MGCICLLLGANLLLDLVDLGVELGGSVVGYYTRKRSDQMEVPLLFAGQRGRIGQATHTLAVIFPESNDLIDGLDRGKTLALAFPDLLGVAAALSNYLEHMAC